MHVAQLSYYDNSVRKNYYHLTRSDVGRRMMTDHNATSFETNQSGARIQIVTNALFK